jgi:four helix bundle protein
MHKFIFKNLVIWQKAMALGEDMNLLALNFKKNELYNLSSQIIRAVNSDALIISEGSIGQSNPKQNRFIGYVIRSLARTVTCLHKAKRRNYLNVEDFQKYYVDSFHLMNMLLAYRKSLK